MTTTYPEIKISVPNKKGPSESFWATPLGHGLARVENNLVTVALVCGDVVRITDGLVTGIESRGDRLQVFMDVRGKRKPRPEVEKRFYSRLAAAISHDGVTVEGGFRQLTLSMPADVDLDDLMMQALAEVLSGTDEDDRYDLRRLELTALVLSCPCQPLDLKLRYCPSHAGAAISV